jgi:hypothetical protein
VRLVQLGQVLRTVRHFTPRQAVAQVLHVLRGASASRVDPIPAPSRSVTTASVTFLPAPVHAHYDGVRGFELIHRSHRFRDQIDWNYEGEGPLWVFHLHQFDYLRAPSHSAATRRRLIEDWIEYCEDGPGWAPHPISLRTLSWGKLLLTPGALDLNEAQSKRLYASMALQAETLSRGLEIRLQANHLFSNLLGVVFAGLLFEGEHANRWLARESELRREIEIQIQQDGSHIEGSPMYHALLLENVLDLLNLARTCGARAPAPLIASLEGAAARMLSAHRVWTHPDGEIALLGDSAFEIAHPTAALEAYAASLGIEAKCPAHTGALADAGVWRLESRDLVVIATAAPPSPAYQPGHAHCDALSFELSLGTERVVTDTGVSEYIPGELREISRRTLSHATMQIDDSEQSEIWAPHRVGGRCRVGVDAATESRLDAHCTSWSRPGTRHHRSFQLSSGRLTIEDRIEGAPAPVTFALPLAPGLQAELRVRNRTGAGGGNGADAGEDHAPELASESWQLIVKLRDGRRMTVELPKGVTWSIESSAYFPRFGTQIERACLVGKADEFKAGTWRFSISRGNSRNSTRSRRGRR